MVPKKHPALKCVPFRSCETVDRSVKLIGTPECSVGAPQG
jgi:hypothetical protein